MPASKPRPHAPERPTPKSRAAALRTQAGDKAVLDGAAPAHEVDRPAHVALPLPRAVIDGLTIASQPTKALLALHGIAGTISRVASGMAALPHTVEDHSTGAVNVAGRFANWVAELAGEIELAVQDEARLRQPASALDAERRLLILARSTVGNGNPNEMHAFAADLTAEADRIVHD